MARGKASTWHERLDVADLRHEEVVTNDRSRIHLDEVRGLGTVLEIEVVLADGEVAADGEQVARELPAMFGVRVVGAGGVCEHRPA